MEIQTPVRLMLQVIDEYESGEKIILKHLPLLNLFRGYQIIILSPF